MSTVDEAIAVLNRIHEADPTVLPKLIAYRAECNEALAKDPTVQVGQVPVWNRGAAKPELIPGWEVGLLGIINGIFGVDDQQSGFIAAFYDNEGNLIRFDLTKSSG